MSKVISERMYQILKRPLVTEKTTGMAEGNWVAFEVLPDARKLEIRAAIEAMYNVKVEKINTLIQKGKAKRFRGFMGQRSAMKKAYVRLKDGQSIDLGINA